MVIVFVFCKIVAYALWVDNSFSDLMNLMLIYSEGNRLEQYFIVRS